MFQLSRVGGKICVYVSNDHTKTPFGSIVNTSYKSIMLSFYIHFYGLHLIDQLMVCRNTTMDRPKRQDGGISIFYELQTKNRTNSKHFYVYLFEDVAKELA